MTKEQLLKEFISDNYGELNSKVPSNLDPKTTSHSTSDKLMKMVGQPFVLGNYRRYYGEAVLPYSEDADKYKDEPEKFFNILKKHKAEKTFGEYFVEKTPDEILKEIAKNKAIGIIEDILTKKGQYNNIFKKTSEDESLNEIKDNNKLIFGQLDKILEFFKTNLDENEKRIILSYINSNMHG